MKSPEFLAELEKIQSLEDAATICKNYSIPVTAQHLLDAQAAPEGEMDEQTLDSISGGGIGAETIGFVLYVINRTCKPVLPSIRSIKKQLLGESL